MNRKLICQILNHEMMLATGCTEPAAIALTAAIAREQLDGELEHIKVRASANIIKNAMSAGDTRNELYWNKLCGCFGCCVRGGGPPAPGCG